ncbi:MAG TPA: CotD family spore coat protein, partial [Bacillota bacterium]|nr:CotD family spore coat protein [Bacillota bacterium]
EIVYPVKENVVNCCTEETVKHIHPSHTTVKNHHLIKNEHYYPHTTSTENFENEVDVQGASTGPGMGGPVMGMGPGSGNQVGGAMDGQGHHGNHHGHCNKHKGCHCHSRRRRNRRF